jgi:hypothetical protein
MTSDEYAEQAAYADRRVVATTSKASVSKRVEWPAATRMTSAIRPITGQQLRHSVFEALCGGSGAAARMV